MIQQPAMSNVPIDGSLKDMGISDLTHPAYRLLSFQAVDGCLDGSVRRPRLSKSFLHFTDGCSQWLVQVPAGSYVYPGLCQINGHDYMDINQYISADERRNMQVLDAYLHGNLTIKTDDPEQSTLAIPFYAIVGQFKS